MPHPTNPMQNPKKPNRRDDTVPERPRPDRARPDEREPARQPGHPGRRDDERDSEMPRDEDVQVE